MVDSRGASPSTVPRGRPPTAPNWWPLLLKQERLSLDILEDLKWWAVGWIDWRDLAEIGERWGDKGRRLDRLATRLEMRNTDPRLPSIPVSSRAHRAPWTRSRPHSAASSDVLASQRGAASTLESSRRRNLLVDVNGGPNHLKNLCDANMIQDAAGEKGGQPLIKQAFRSLRAGFIDESRNHRVAGRAGVLLLHGPLLALPRPGRQAGSGLKHSRGRDPAGDRRRHKKRRVAPPAWLSPPLQFQDPPPSTARRRVTVRSGGRARLGQSGPSWAIWAHLGPLEREASVTFRGAGAALLFEPCDAASAVQQFRFATASLIADKIAASLIANGTDDAQASDGSHRPPASCVFDGSSSGVGARLGRVPARRRVRRALHHAGMLVPEGAVVGVRRRRRGGPRGGAGRRACAPRLFTRAAVNRRTTAGAGTRSGTCSR